MGSGSEPASLRPDIAHYPDLEKEITMAYRISIGYKQPADPEAFDTYYNEKHLPLASQIPGVTRFAAGKTETFDGTTPDNYLIAEISFESKEKALAALASPEGQAATADLGNFATGGAAIHFSNEDIIAP